MKKLSILIIFAFVIVDVVMSVNFDYLKDVRFLQTKNFGGNPQDLALQIKSKPIISLVDTFFQISSANVWLMPISGTETYGDTILFFPYTLDAYEVWQRVDGVWKSYASGTWLNPKEAIGQVILPRGLREGEWLIAISDDYLSTIQMRLVSEASAIKRDWYRDLIQPGYLILLLVFSFLAGLATILTRHKILLFYWLFTFSLAIFHAWDTGLLVRISLYLIPLFKGYEFWWKVLPILTGFWLSIIILDIHKRKKLGLFYAIGTSVIILLCVVFWYLDRQKLATQILYFSSLLTMVGNFAFALLEYRKASRTKLFFLLGWSPMLVITIITVLRGFFGITIQEMILNSSLYLAGLNQNFFLFFIFWEIHRKVNAELSSVSGVLASFVPQRLFKLLGINDPQNIQRGVATTMDLTILFVDIRSFTKLSESLNPADVFNLLNDYCDTVALSVNKYGGILDKFIGDGGMALFPGHPSDAVQCAVDLVRTIEHKGKGYRIGVGLHTGEVMLGILGSKERLACTAVSDHVNLASRIQDLNKSLGTEVLLSEATYQTLPSEYQNLIRKIGTVSVPGRDAEITIYENFSPLPVRSALLRLKTKDQMEHGLIAMQEFEFTKALEEFRGVLSIDVDDRVAIQGMERCLEQISALEQRQGLRSVDLAPWREEWNLGVPIIDKQHQKFWGLINQVLLSIRLDRTILLITEVIKDLEIYAKGHFFYEELLMEKSHYLDIRDHRRSHDFFHSEIISAIKNDLIMGNKDLWEKTAQMMSSWFYHHILHSDKDFVIKNIDLCQNQNSLVNVI